MLIRTDRAPLWVETRGTGEPVVLLHSLALSSEIWGEFANRLAAEFEVWLVDLRGHGHSPWDQSPFTIADLARDVAALLDARGIERASLVGISMGGSVALTLAGLQPQRVPKLVLADTTAWYGPTARDDWRQRARRAVELSRPDQLEFQIDRWFTRGFRIRCPEIVETVSSSFVATESGVHAAACLAMGELDARELLPSIAALTLVMVGAEDTATPRAMAEDLATCIPLARLVVVDEASHLALVERPDLALQVAAHLAGRNVD